MNQRERPSHVAVAQSRKPAGACVGKPLDVAAHWIQIFRDFYGPTHKAFAALDPAGQDALAKDIAALLNRCNTAGSASLVVPAEYLEVVITKQ